MIRLRNEGEDILTKEELRHFAECATCRDLLQEAMKNVVEESSEK